MFFILDTKRRKLSSFDEGVNGKEKLKQILGFNKSKKSFRYFINQQMLSVTCYQETLSISSSDWKPIIEEYNLTNCLLIRTHMPPISCEADQHI